VRVLFVGNSFTAQNSMPEMVSKLAKGDPDGPAVFVARFAPPGATLADSVKSKRLLESIAADPWDFVVLQEQSQLPSRPYLRMQRMYPAAALLEAHVDASGAEALLFMTWGYRAGDTRGGPPGDTYAAMQERIYDGYRELGARLGPVRVAPVGRAWSEAVIADPRAPLWAGDGRHPSRAGSYLAACVFYGMVTGRDPRGSRFTAGLRRGQAQALQSAAREALPLPAR
jgi:hypothetical protein